MLHLRLSQAVPVLVALLAGACLADEPTRPGPVVPPHIPVVPPLIPHHYVSPTGSPAGDGTPAAPWDLETVLRNPAKIRPGDTVWVRGGTYRGDLKSYLSGTTDQPKVLRAYPGERAVLDGSLHIAGPNAVFWGLEVTDSRFTQRVIASSGSHPAENEGRSGWVDVQAANTKIINFIIHDGTGGIGFWSSAPDSEIYGTIIFNVGWDAPDRGHGHGIYAQNRNGSKRIRNNILFYNFGNGIAAYGSARAALNNFEITDNISFSNGAISRNPVGRDLFLGGEGPVINGKVLRNRVFNRRGQTSIMGYQSMENQGLLYEDNYVAGGVALFRGWGDSIQVRGNTFVALQPGRAVEAVLTENATAPGISWDRNRYFSSGTAAGAGTATRSMWLTEFAQTPRQRGMQGNFTQWRQATGWDLASEYSEQPTLGSEVFLHPNEYEPGRAHVAVFNWSRNGSVEVDLSNLLQKGDSFEVRNVQRLFDPPVLQGVYDGELVRLPMQAVNPPIPQGLAGAPVSAGISTGSEFHAFLVTSNRGRRPEG
jgi:hypothetical protein